MKRFINLTSFFPQVTLKLFYLLILLLTSEAYSQTFTVKGNITTTDSTPVKYASVTFVDQSDTTKKCFAITDTSGNYQLSVVTDLKDETPTLPQSFELMQNYPNPFSDETNIPYKLNEVSNASVTIYNILGQEVKSFKSLEQAGGMHGIRWDGRDDFGKKVSTGVYFYRLLAKGETQVKKMIFTVGGGTNAKLTGGVFPYKGIKKEITEKTASGVYTVQIANADNTRPKILFSESSNVIIQQDTTLDFKIEKGIMAYSLVYEKADSALVNGSYRYNWELYLNNLTGTKPKNITNWQYDDYSPKWSPDGKYIAFRRDQPSGAANLYIYDTANDTVRGVVVSNFINTDLPSWTPDSKHILYTYHVIPNPSEIHVIGVNGTNDRKITHSPAAIFNDNYTYLWVNTDSGKVYKSNFDDTINDLVIDLWQYGETTIIDFNAAKKEILFVASTDGNSSVKSYNLTSKILKDEFWDDTGYHFVRPKWATDGSMISVMEFKNIIDKTHDEYLSVLENGVLKKLYRIAMKEKEGGSSYFYWNTPLFSADNKYIAFVKLFMAQTGFLHTALYIVEVATGDVQLIADKQAQSFNWNPMKPNQ